MSFISGLLRAGANGSRMPERVLIAVLFVGLSCLPGVVWAQSSSEGVQRPATVQGWAERLDKFGRSIPQEKVFLHLDNNCYFAGDTIWFKAYVTRTDSRKPSALSGVLYVELLNPEGYLYERQLIRLQQGQGRGSIALTDSAYGGYYELRAYTRWMLNWGEHQHEHSSYASNWFFSAEMAREYYRDYDKLYSRVFPVYDKPQEPGDYVQDMTSRPLTRYFKSTEVKEEAVLSFYPEGGSLVSGAAVRVAFEANNQEGKHLEGKLTVRDASGEVVAQAETMHRGRGVFSLTCRPGERYKAEFQSGALTARKTFPEAAAQGCALRVEQADGALQVHVHPVGLPSDEALGVTVMSSGVLQAFKELSPASDGEQTLTFPLDELLTGVNQITVFNADGRVYADRLCFLNPAACAPNSLVFDGIETSYQPYDPIRLTVRRKSGAGGGTVSLAVRDATTTDYLYDNGTLLTEMLLASEVKGFIEQPGYYFEKDDAERRSHLDLLMMVQGWRRFDWVTMAEPGAFALKHPYEKTQWLTGTVNRYTAQEEEDLFRDMAREDMPQDEPQQVEQENQEEVAGDFYVLTERMRTFSSNADRMVDASGRFHEKESALKREVTVHAEFVQPGSEPVMGEMMTRNGRFSIQAPLFEENCVFFLGAVDTLALRAKQKPYAWVSQDEGEYPPFYVRIAPCYPNFVKPYTFYQQNRPPLPEGSAMLQTLNADERMLATVTVRTKHGGKRSFLSSKPALVVDAYEAFNRACDAGLCTGKFIGAQRFIQDVARAYVGDMGDNRGYKLQMRYDRRPTSFNMSPGEKNKYNKLYNLNKLYIYTDYAPRMEGSKRYDGSNQPEVIVDLHRLPNEGMRVTYRDRRYVLPGFAVCNEFYSPDYSACPLLDAKDYRRTLYWNPDLPLDENGQANVTLYNNAKETQIVVSAEGFGTGGEWLSGSSHPEER